MTKYSKRPIHRSYKCECKLKNDEKYISRIIENFIVIYKRYSVLLIFNNRKIKYNNIQQNFYLMHTLSHIFKLYIYYYSSIY